MSRRNSREGKAKRRAERAERRKLLDDPARLVSVTLSADGSTDVRSLDELARMAERGERLPCGCDARQHLDEMRDAH